MNLFEMNISSGASQVQVWLDKTRLTLKDCFEDKLLLRGCAGWI